MNHLHTMHTVVQTTTFAAALAAGPASAAVFSLNPDPLDAAVKTGATDEVTQAGDFALRVGEFFGPSQSYVFAFQVPEGTTGETVQSADLQVNIFEQVGEPPYNLDLYGLGTRSVGGPSTNDPFVDSFEGSTAVPVDLTNATLIQSDYIVPADGSDTVNTTAGGDLALAAYLNNELATAAVGQFIYFRLSPDSEVPNSNTAYTLLTGNAGLPGEAPVLSFETGEVIPEPASLALVGLGSLLVIGRRRRA